MFTIAQVELPLRLLVLLLAMLAVCVAVYVMLTRAATSNRQWRELRQWAAAAGLPLHTARKAAAPEPLADILKQPKPLVVIGQQRFFLAQIQSSAPPGVPTPTASARWHLLLRQIPYDWPATGLRPVAHASSVLDFLPLNTFPSLAPPQRFVVFGTQTAAAKLLAASQLRALTPWNVGLLVRGQWLILEFSTRPFDSIEAQRMTVLAQQLAASLPPPPEST